MPDIPAVHWRWAVVQYPRGQVQAGPLVVPPWRSVLHDLRSIGKELRRRSSRGTVPGEIGRSHMNGNSNGVVKRLKYLSETVSSSSNARH